VSGLLAALRVGEDCVGENESAQMVTLVIVVVLETRSNKNLAILW